jgi:hypothetical protein
MGQFLYTKFDPQPWFQEREKSSSVAHAPSALPLWKRRTSKVTFPTAVRVRWSGASWTRRPKPNFWISAPACRQETTTARPVGFAVRFRLRDYLRQGLAHSDPHLIELWLLIRVLKLLYYIFRFLSQEHWRHGERTVLGIRIRIHRIRMFLGFLNLDPLVRDPDPDPSLFWSGSRSLSQRSGSGSTPKCHGSPTLQGFLQNVAFRVS